MREVSELMHTLDTGFDADTEAAWARLEHDTAALRYRTAAVRYRTKVPAWTAIAAFACLAVVLLIVSPAKAVAQKFLAILRIQNVLVVPVNIGNSGPAELLSRAIGKDVVVTEDPGRAKPLRSLDELRTMFPARVPAALGQPSDVALRGDAAFHLTVDRERLLGVLESSGLGDLNIPENIDGATINVHIKPIASINYGTCAAESEGPSPRCIRLVEAQGPVVSVPPGLDVTALAEAALQISGLSPEDAKQLAHSVDWTTTFVVTVPRREATVQTVFVDGVKGSLVQATHKQAEYALVWNRDGFIYAMHGIGNPGQAVAAADTMQ